MSRQNKDCKEQDCSQSVRNGYRRRNEEEDTTCTQREPETQHCLQADGFFFRGVFCWFFGGDCFVGLGFFTGLPCIFAVPLVPHSCSNYYCLLFH